MSGCRIVLRDKFSRRRFFPDVAMGHVTHIMYIGEILRYLLKDDENDYSSSIIHHPSSSIHHPPSIINRPASTIKVIAGNGLRLDIWEKFQNKFHIPLIVEWYASTEGTLLIANLDGVKGACGRVPLLLLWICLCG